MFSAIFVTYWANLRSKTVKILRGNSRPKRAIYEFNLDLKSNLFSKILIIKGLELEI
jgi:hypothetical protein